jgi:ATP-binding cassette subfamily B multidrug efflux pump
VALANLIVSFTKAVASAARLNEVFALRSELVDGEWEKAEAKAEAAKVKMEHVTFCYPGSQESALEDISFTASRRDDWNHWRDRFRQDNSGQSHSPVL